MPGERQIALETAKVEVAVQRLQQQNDIKICGDRLFSCVGIGIVA